MLHVPEISKRNRQARIASHFDMGKMRKQNEKEEAETQSAEKSTFHRHLKRDIMDLSKLCLNLCVIPGWDDVRNYTELWNLTEGFLSD